MEKKIIELTESEWFQLYVAALDRESYLTIRITELKTERDLETNYDAIQFDNHLIDRMEQQLIDIKEVIKTIRK